MNPSRGEIWSVDLDPVRGHEQAGRRPALILSVDLFNEGPSGLVVVLPITTRDRGLPWHLPVLPPEGGLARRSFIKTEDVRSISTERLVRRLGRVSGSTLEMTEERVRILLGL